MVFGDKRRRIPEMFDYDYPAMLGVVQNQESYAQGVAAQRPFYFDHIPALTDRAMASPTVARLLVAGGGLAGEHVPWLVRAGVRQFHVGRSVRPGGTWGKAYVDPAHVRSWRLLLDDAVEHALAAARPGTGAGSAR